MTRDDKTLASYPDALRKAILTQRAALRAAQESGVMKVGPWVPTTRLGQPKRRKPHAVVVPIQRLRGTR